MVYVFVQMGLWHQLSCSSTVMNSGMQGTDGLFNDGLDSTTCKNNGQVCLTGSYLLCSRISYITP